MQKNTSKKGFTLVEIMIVVVIIGLLAAMAVPAFNKVRLDSRQSAVENDARQLASAAQQYMLETGSTSVAHSYDSSDGTINAALQEYVRKIGKGYTIAPASLSIDGTFSINHNMLGTNGPITFSPEGQVE